MHILRIQCPDRTGLIAAITRVIADNGLNIEVMKEFVEPVSKQFFARLEITGEPDTIRLSRELRYALPYETQIDLHQARPKRIVLMVTREHHCLSDLLVRHHFGELLAEVVGVMGNYDKLQPLVAKFDIPFVTVSHEGLSKPEFETAMLRQLAEWQPDYIVLAKFMRILSPEFVAAYPNRILNIHHSFLPAFVGANPYRQAYERGVKLIGATAHVVTNDLDEGPIITQRVRSVDHEYSVQGMVQAGHEIEKAVLAEALKLILEDRVFVVRNRTIIFD